MHHQSHCILIQLVALFWRSSFCCRIWVEASKHPQCKCIISLKVSYKKLVLQSILVSNGEVTRQIIQRLWIKARHEKFPRSLSSSGTTKESLNPQFDVYSNIQILRIFPIQVLKCNIWSKKIWLGEGECGGGGATLSPFMGKMAPLCNHRISSSSFALVALFQHDIKQFKTHHYHQQTDQVLARVCFVGISYQV